MTAMTWADYDNWGENGPEERVTTFVVSDAIASPPRLKKRLLDRGTEPDRSWVPSAACTGMDHHAFVEGDLGSGHHADYTLAKKTCRSCEVHVECLNYILEVEAEDTRNRHGYWGRMTPHERGIEWKGRNRVGKVVLLSGKIVVKT